MNVPIDTDSLATWPAALALVVRAETDDQEDWAALKALRVIRDLAAHGGRVLVVEIGEGRPRLARLLRVPHTPGIGDVLAGEAAIPTAAKAPEGERFYYIGPGKRRAEPVGRDPAWAEIARRLASGGARLVVYTRLEDWPQPDGIPGIEGAVILDAGGSGSPPGGVKVLAQLVAPSGVRGHPPAVPVAESPLLARRRSRRRAPAASVAILALVAIALLWWLLTAGPRVRGAGSEPPAAERLLGPPAIDPAATRHLPYSVAVESYSALADALARERRLAGLVRAPVFIAPAAVDGILYYRVFAGLEAEADSAQALLRELVQRGVKDSVRAADVRTLPWTFDLGLFPERADAQARQKQLLEIGVPSYIVRVPTTAGTAHQLYVGGYENATDAEVMAGTLERNGLRVPLVQRMGS